VPVKRISAWLLVLLGLVIEVGACVDESEPPGATNVEFPAL
jgi:hypothetical protein